MEVETTGPWTIKPGDPNGKLITFPSIVGGPYARGLLTVDWQHDDTSEVTVRAVAPDGRKYNLHQRTGRKAHDGLMAFELPASDVANWNGIWSCQFLDHVKGNGGVIRNASLSVQNGFEVDLRATGFTTSQEQQLYEVRDELKSIIRGVAGVAAWTFRVDCSAVPIDGVGQILGQAGPTRFDVVHGLPTRAIFQLDTADAEDLMRRILFKTTTRHEVWHGLGGGTAWVRKQVASGFDFIGEHAMEEYARLGGSGPVPIEQLGGGGTAGAHWSEAVFGNECNTGWIDNPPNPLSRMSIASFKDMGYVVDLSRAENYALPLRGLRSSDAKQSRGCRFNPEMECREVA